MNTLRDNAEFSQADKDTPMIDRDEQWSWAIYKMPEAPLADENYAFRMCGGYRYRGQDWRLEESPLVSLAEIGTDVVQALAGISRHISSLLSCSFCFQCICVF